MNPVSTYTVSMASAATFSSAVDLGNGWNRVSLIIPTMPSGADIYLLGSDTISGTYRRVFHGPNTNSAVVAGYFVTSAVTNCILPLTNWPLQFCKVELSSATADNAYTFKFVCSYS